MKAVVYEKRNYPDVLQYCEVDKPALQDDEVLVKIHATSINAADYRSMRLGNIPKRKIFGADISGRVEATGRNANKFKIGDEVFGDILSSGFGGFAEYAAVPESVLAFKPAGVSFEDAAALPIAAITALQGLRDKGNIQPGKKVLIYGSGGGVGTFAIQLAKYYGAHVTAVCHTHNIDTSLLIGADRTIDYTKEDVLDSGDRFDLILAVNGDRPLRLYRQALNPEGFYVMLGGGYAQIFKSLLFGGIMSMGGKKMRSLAAKSNQNDLDFLINLVKEGKLKPVIDRRYPLEQTAEAVEYIRQGHARGKVILNIAAG